MKSVSKDNEFLLNYQKVKLTVLIYFSQEVVGLSFSRSFVLSEFSENFMRMCKGVDPLCASRIPQADVFKYSREGVLKYRKTYTQKL